MPSAFQKDGWRSTWSAKLSAITRSLTRSARAGWERWTLAPIPGGPVCSMHGGKAPQVQRTARERLQDLVDPAIDGLRQALEGDNLPSIVRASQLVLDRCGFGPTSKLEVEEPPPRGPDPVLEWIPLERLKQMRAWHQQMLEWRAEAEAAMEAGEDPPA